MELQLPSKVSQCDAWEFMSSQISDNAVNTRGIMKLLMIRKSVNYAIHTFLYFITFSCFWRLWFLSFFSCSLILQGFHARKQKKLVNFLFCGRKHRLTPALLCRKKRRKWSWNILKNCLLYSKRMVKLIVVSRFFCQPKHITYLNRHINVEYIQANTR